MVSLSILKNTALVGLFDYVSHILVTEGALAAFNQGLSYAFQSNLASGGSSGGGSGGGGSSSSGSYTQLGKGESSGGTTCYASSCSVFDGTKEEKDAAGY